MTTPPSNDPARRTSENPTAGDPGPAPYYVTTPIYYVNDRPHIGHCYTTLLADVAARAQRLLGRDVFFLTGTDEHAEKVVTAAIEHGMTPQEWADHNAARFREAFEFMGFSNDDFVRTSEDRHKDRASAYIAQLIEQGDIELGDYEGWYDPSQEEYVTDTVAKEHEFKSPVTGRALEKRVEQNYFFDLPRHAEWLEGEIASDRIRVLPEARKNEVLGRIKQGLNRVPVSRRVKEDDQAGDWGIRMPGDPSHRVYVWIEALCNYRTVIDTDALRRYWDEPVHLMAKDILWFHAVIWPCMLRALGVKPPAVVYAHAYWIAEGRKMSKSLGNFIEIDLLRAYAERYSLDAVRWFLTTQGPMGANDADFAHSRFVEVYNADLANGIGNCASRVSNMIAKYFDGKVPEDASPEGTVLAEYPWPTLTKAHASAFADNAGKIALDQATRLGIDLAAKVDAFIGLTRPFSIAKDLDGEPAIEGLTNQQALASILYQCAEAVRIASLMLYPAMPGKMAELWRNWGCSPLNDPNDAESGFRAPLAALAQWAHPEWGLKAGQAIDKGEALFMRADVKEDAPTA